MFNKRSQFAISRYKDNSVERDKNQKGLLLKIQRIEIASPKLELSGL